MCLYVHELNYDSENVWKRNLAAQGKTIGEGGIGDLVLNNSKISKSTHIICDSSEPDRVMALRKVGWDNAISVGKKEKVVPSVSTLSQLKVFYTSTSTNIYYEQENYEREVDRYGIVLETPIDKDNHHIDEIRYVVTYLKRQGIIKIV
jgi:phage terminase large subunit